MKYKSIHTSSTRKVNYIKCPGDETCHSHIIIYNTQWPNQTYSPVLSYWLSFRIHKLSANRRVGLVWHCTRNYTIARPLYSFDRKYLLWQEITYFDMNIILKALLLKDMRTNCWKYGKVHDYWSIFPVTFQSFVGRIFQPSR